MSNVIFKHAWEGKPVIDFEIIDSHCHMGTYYNFYFPKADIEEMLYDADLVGISRMSVAPHAAISCDYKLGNEQIAAVAAQYPERVWALLVLNANMPEEIDPEFNKYYGKKEFVGVKLHPALHGYNVAADQCSSIYDHVRRLGGYILCHSWEGSNTCSVELCEAVIKAYPDVPFVLGHSGGLMQGIYKSINLVNRYENAFMDTSGFEFSNVWIEEIVQKTDATKILFGSDCPFHDIRGGISRILFADIEEDTKRLILGMNYKNMLSKLPKK